MLVGFINDFTYWNDHKDKDSSGNKDSPSAARYVSRKLAVMHELVKVKSNGNFGKTSFEPFHGLF